MNKIIKYIDQNKEKVLKIIFCIILFFTIIQLGNSMYQNQQKELVKKNVIDSSITTIDNYSDYIVTSKNTVSKKESTTIKETMDQFVKYCNELNIEEAYEMLTDKCKQALFSNIDIFKNNYIDNIFAETRYYDMQAWSSQDNVYTFLVNFTGDILSTGGATITIQEYYTFIKQEDGTYKININNYIYGQDYENLILEQDEIKCEIISINTFKDFVEYEFIIYNETDSDILLNGDKYKYLIYLLDNNNVNYSSISSEFEKDEEIIVNSYSKRNFKVRFNKVYNPKSVVKKIVFNDIVFNYEEYKDAKNNGQIYENRKTIKFNIR